MFGLLLELHALNLFSRSYSALDICRWVVKWMNKWDQHSDFVHICVGGMKVNVNIYELVFCTVCSVYKHYTVNLLLVS